MEFHIARHVREELGLNDVLFSFTGNVIFADVAASRRLAQRLTAARAAKSATAPPVNAGALHAMGLIDELSHAIIARYREQTDPAVLAEGLRFLAAHTSPAAVDRLLRTFTAEFPNTAIYNGKLTVDQWLAGTTDKLSHREAAFEELLLLWLANTNPAFAPFRELFADQDLRASTAYTATTSALPQYFETRPAFDPAVGTLLDALQAPMKAAPDSLSAQLDFIRETWAPVLGDELRHILLAVDTLREEEIAIWMRFHPPAPDKYLHGEPRFEAHGFHGDEYVGFDEEWVTGSDGVRTRRKYASDFQAPLVEYEAFSADYAWMPNVVLMAKSTYVWLEQLSKKYGRHIHRLDHIPDEELKLLADRGITALWLIGLWERSIASRTIKRLRGHADAVASAYSLKDYFIAEDLGGNEAYERLRDNAARFGLRLASDMVPNHMGIDSSWVVDHPDWFLSRPQPPYPAYTFNGPDLSADPRVEIKLEDHYYDQTDAAVAFKVHHHREGVTRYMYHGNDGTTFAWNDTAQLDYSKAYVREQVIQTILHVARQFPIIRFDAAMVLAKRHVQRLWFPLPGVGGSIPSRAEDAMTQEQFDALMPHEFWREVVDRVAVEVPGTLLLAEAFWMLEGYFVRTLGMHRVYNSAFMNMLRDEENAKYRSYLKKTIEFDPDILKRYVNFMSNPDERTTIDQFGNGDKCFGVATMMCTLPGLPMFGHGQIEGYTERYGMEYKQAKMEEWPDENLVRRHQHEIAPLLHRRWAFAESTHFALFDFWCGDGSIDENVYAYSNRSGDAPSLVLFNNSYNSTEGTVRWSAESMDKGSGQMRSRSVTEALALTGDDAVMLAFRDHARGLAFLVRAADLAHNGFHIALRGYQYAVLLDWRELRSTAQHPWDRLCDALQGAGVPNLDEALSKLRLRPLHNALREALSPALLQAFASGATTAAANFSTAAAEFFARAAEQHTFPAASTPYAATLARFAAALPTLPAQAACLLTPSPVTPSPLTLQQTPVSTAAAALLPGSGPEAADRLWAPVLAYSLLRALPGDAAARAHAFDELHLRSALADIFAGLGFAGDDNWRAAARVRLLLAHDAHPLDSAATTPAFWQDPDVRWLVGVHESGGTTYCNREQLDELLCWLALPALLRAEPAVANHIAALAQRAADAGYVLDAFLAPPPAPPPVPPTPAGSVNSATTVPTLPAVPKAAAGPTPMPPTPPKAPTVKPKIKKPKSPAAARPTKPKA